MLWTGDLADILAEGGWWFWVWSDPGFPDGDLAEVLIADLADDGVGCSSCAGACDTPPMAEGAPIFEECPEPDEGGEGGEGGDNNCESDGPIEPSHCLTMSPNPPVEDEPVTIALIIEGEQVQITPEEPICFAPDELCLLVEDGDVELNDDGSITFIWTGDMQDRVEEGWAWVWNEEFELLAEVSLAVLAENGEGCSTCAIPPVEVPATGFLGLALLALLSALVGALSLRRRTA